jgi:hypothetical protein
VVLLSTPVASHSCTAGNSIHLLFLKKNGASLQGNPKTNPDKTLIFLYILHQKLSLLMKVCKALIMMFAMLSFFTTCKKEYSFEGEPAESIAAGSLQNVSGNCGPVIINGVYKRDSIIGEENYVVISVHFTSPGRYEIYTDTQNGFSFGDSAFVTDTGYQSIKLKATGKPILAQATNFSIRFDTSYCSFSVNVVAGSSTPIPSTPINLAESAWQFSQGSQSFHGYFDGASTDVINGSNTLTLVGLSTTKDTAIAIIIDMGLSSGVKTGTYKSTTSSSFSFFDYTGRDIFTADKTTTGAEMTILITAYEPTTKIVEGTFTGTALNRAGQPVPLTAGKFMAQLN